ncbi:MAG: DUF488 family protein [Chloroflexi bacterium]|nr:DUF488 family protein [Chloroflexota bacterium]
MIRLASIYQARQPSPDDGFRVLVMRRWPRGVRQNCTDLWLKEAGPSRELLHAYSHQGLAWDQFELRYRAEMLDQRADVLEVIRALEREHGVITLLCHERIPPKEHCHREVLLDLLNTTQPLEALPHG